MPLLSFFLPSLCGGGAERVVLQLASSMSKRGEMVDLVLASATGEYLENVPKAVRIIDLNCSRVVTAVPKLVAYIKRENPAALLSTLNHANVAAIVAAKIASTRCRVIVRQASNPMCDIGNPRIANRVLKALMSIAYPLADDVVAVSEGVARDLSLLGYAPSRRTHVIYNPIDMGSLINLAEEHLVDPWFEENAAPVVLAAGRLVSVKDFHTLIAAFSHLRRTVNANLVILGEGPLRPCLEKQVINLGLEGCVRLAGFKANPFAYMQRASVFVLSSIFEGFPNVLIQAMAVGTPVVATDCPHGPDEILDGGRFGRLVPPGDVLAMAAAMGQTLSAPPMRDDLRMRASVFGIEESVRKYHDLMVSGRIHA